MRLQLVATVIGALLLGYPIIGLGQTSAGASDQAANNAPLGSEQNPVKISSGVMMGLVIHREIPRYPVVRCGDPAPPVGQVVTRAIINPEGKVDKLTVVSGPEVKREANLKALRQWTFKPYLLNGAAVWVQTTILIIVDMGCEPK
jgi:hypothetical protein